MKFTKLSQITMVLAILALSSFTEAAPPAAPTIGWPANGRYFNRVDNSIGGRCGNGNTVVISGDIQNGPLRVPCSQGRYSSAFTFTGANAAKALRVAQTNSDGSSPQTSIQVHLDTQAPLAPTVSAPAAGSTVARTGLTVQGSCESDATVKVAGAVTAAVTARCASGRFSIAVQLKPANGSKNLVVTQKDLANNPSPRLDLKVSLRLAGTPGKPGISSPAAQAWVPQARLTASGKCQNGASVRLFGDLAAPQTATCANGLYSASIQLSSTDGKKTIRATQTNSVATSDQSSRVVYLDTIAPAAPAISSPAQNAALTSQDLVVSGACELNSMVTLSGALVGAPLQLSCSADGRFSRASQLTAGSGAKSISATQTDRAGNVSPVRTVSVTLGAVNPNPGWGPRNSTRMFLSGHSLMDNPLVDYVAAIAAATSNDFNYNQQIVIGSPIRVRTKGMNGSASGWPGYSTGKNKNTDDLNLINEIRNPQTLGAGEKYDTFVLTESHSSLSAILYENTTGFTRHYQDLMIAGNPGTRSFFYHSWLDINKSNPAPWITHEKNSQVTWECTVSKVNESLRAANRSDRIRLLPAGGALVDLVERVLANEIPEISGSTSAKMNRIFIDDVHMTNLGMYYLALVVFSSTYGKSAIGSLPPAEVGISNSLARSLQTVAWNFVNSYYSQSGDPSARTMASCRSFIANNSCSSYYTLKNETDEIPRCRNFFSQDADGNPFGSGPLSVLPTPW